MPRQFVRQTRIGFFYARYGRFRTWITFGTAFLQAAHALDPFPDALRSRPVDRMIQWKTEALDGNRLVDTLRVNPAVVQDDPAAKGMAYQANGKIVDDVQQRGKIQNVFGPG